MNTLYDIALTKVKGIGSKHARTLLSLFSSAEDIFKSSKDELLSFSEISSYMINTVLSPENLDKALQIAYNEMNLIEKNHIQVLSITSAAYPRRLKNCEDAPTVLYYKGQGELNPARSISVVGSRNATSYGRKLCDKLIEELSDMNVQIVSGLAYGIDIHAHRAALKQQSSTVAVLGHGLSKIYPESHRETAYNMLAGGGLLTEFSFAVAPARQHFPMRNRIIAGLADAVVVVEAANKGGALITAEIANSYNRDVCAFPGAVGQPYSEGCNYLIKTNRAHLIRGADDLCYMMGWEREKQSQQEKQLPLFTPTLTKDEKKVYDYLEEKEQATIDEIAVHCRWPQSQLAMTLLGMEISGITLSLPGKVYKNIR